MNVDAIRQYQYTQSIPQERGNGVADGRDAPQARIKRRTMGLSLGKLGIELSSSDVELDSSLSPEAVETRRKANAFDAERQVGSLRAQVARQAVASRQAALGSAETSSTSVFRRGMAAYNNSAQPESPLPGTLFQAAV